jgi:XTP/dITP diphosphohydrolase
MSGPAPAVILATRNPGKLREINQVLAPLGIVLAGLEGYPGLDEPQETGATFAHNACLKACYCAQHTGRWCLADDSGLEVDALDGRPGVYSARYGAGQCPPDSPRQVIDAANNARLLRELAGVPLDRRTARFVCHLALADPQQVLAEAFDTIEGVIGHEGAGENGFGYDPLFVLPDRGCTTAQLGPAEKNAISHRGKAVRHLAGLMRALSDRGA